MAITEKWIWLSDKTHPDNQTTIYSANTKDFSGGSFRQISGSGPGCFSGGSFLVVYAVSAISEKQKFRATMSAVWGVVNIFLLISYALDGSFTVPVLIMSAWALIPIAAATICGGLLVKKLNQQTFLKVAYILLIVSGAILLVTNI